MSKHSKVSQSGLSLVEMMISITLGLLIMAGLTSILVSNSRARNEVEQANRQIENGRYALQMLTDDLRLAGYLAEFDPYTVADPTTMPAPCDEALTDLVNALPLHVQGLNNVTSATPLACLSDVKTGTDVLIIRRASTCVAGTANCAPFDNTMPHFQASRCSAFPGVELNVIGATAAALNGNHFEIDRNIANLTLRNRATNCAAPPYANIYRYRTHIYFIANNDKDGDGIPTLKRWELGAGAANPVPLVEGIENFQIEYGIDNAVASGVVGDGVPDNIFSDPSSLTLDAATPSTIAAWRQVVSARIFLLARNTEKTAGFVDDKTVSMNSDGIQTDPCSGLSGSQLTDCKSYKRHAFQSMVRLNNPASRRIP